VGTTREPVRPVGSYGWVRATGGALRTRDRLRELASAIASRLPRPARKAMESIDPANVRAPDSTLAREAEALCREVSPEWLVNHGLRGYLWARVLAGIDGVRDYDDELLYVAAILHDLGLTERYGHPTPTACFTLASADGACELAARHGYDEQRRETLASAITYHLNVRVTLDAAGAEAYLLTAGVALDVVGSRARDVTAEQRAAVEARHPRLGFREAFTERYRASAAATPEGRAAFHLRWLGFARLVK
jgi:hypothetical protein